MSRFTVFVTVASLLGASAAHGQVVSLDNAASWEGNPPSVTRMVFPVNLSAPAPEGASIRFSAVRGSARDGDDFVPVTNGLLEIPPGATNASISIALVEELLVEPDEAFAVILSSPQNLVEREWASGTIVNDDFDFPRMSLSIGDASVLEGNTLFENVRLRFPITLSGPTPLEVRATLLVTPGTASAGDFSVYPLTISIPAGETSSFADAGVTEDDVLEPDETFTVALSDSRGAQLDDATATGTILDDDTASVVTVGDASVVEGDSPSENVLLRFPLTLSPPSPSPGTTVRITTHAGSATPGSDFDPFDWYVSFPTGTSESFFWVQIHENTGFEPDETLTVSLSPNYGTIIGEPSTATGTILNDDDDVTVSVSDASIEEGGAAGLLRMLRFPLALDRPSSKDLRVVFLPVPGSATPPDDYLDLHLYSSAAVTDQVAIIPAGQTQGFAEVGIYQDVEIEPDERFTIELDPEEMQVGTGTATGTILNDDAEGVPVFGAGGALLLAAALLAAVQRRMRSSRT